SLRLLGDLFSKGMDVLVKYQLDKFNFWSTYTLSRSELFFETLKTERFPTNYDQTHLFSLAGQYKTSRLTASVSWSWGSGTPDYTGDAPFFPEEGSFEVPTTATPVGDVVRFGSVSQVDLSVLYHAYEKKQTKVSVGLTVLNLLDTENLLERDARTLGPPGRDEVFSLDRFNIGFAPDVMLRVEF
ncbi:MAG: hypothetical protein AAGA66_04590, partial [Bacteroidota bacterium]